RSGLPVFSEFASFSRSSDSRMISAEPFLMYSSCSSTGLNAVSDIASDYKEIRLKEAARTTQPRGSRHTCTVHSWRTAENVPSCDGNPTQLDRHIARKPETCA